MKDGPIIEYPCKWEYKVIGMDEKQIRTAISDVMGNKNHKVTYSRQSAGGKYTSLNLKTTVPSQGARDRIHEELSKKDCIRMVM